MKTRNYISLFIALVALNSCKGLLDHEPIRSISADEFFDSENALKTYANGFLVRNLPSVESLTRGDQFSDIVVTTQTEAFLRPGFNALTTNNWTTGNWSQLYNINYYLNNIHKAKDKVSEPIIKHYEGVGRFWRAWFYWDKVKLFGDVPWYDKTISSDDDTELYKSRDKRDFVMDKVLEDLDFAINNCTAESKYVNKNVINRYVALALKSRICLFEGTFRKYHGMADYTSWLKASLEASEQLMSNSPYSLVNVVGEEERNYGKLFKSLSPQYQEVILSNEMNLEESRVHDASWFFASGTAGQRNSVTKDFVNMYLNLDGSRYTDQPNYNKKVFYEEFKNRDYRLKQSVITPDYRKIVAGKETNEFAKVFPGLGAQLTYYRIVKWNMDDDAYESNTSSLNSLSVFRFGEVLLNYAEAKAELGEMTGAEWNKSIRLLRERSGVNGKEPVDADPFLKKYYEGVSDKWVLEVRRERAIEMLLEDVRRDDLIRWKMGHKLVVDMAGIYIPELGKPFDMNGDGINDICFYSTTSPRPAATESTVTYVQITARVGDAATTFGINEDNCLVYRLERIWNDKMYLYPIPQAALNVNPELGQNPGWEN
ncbi:RagB/SusD family nutrient uptake outer membrane protein [Sphingobacterium faecale]|uniref:RagB/SusD family nutrient uptake outer membrane protein n=1 Tax=Sphingobacterium faecale TaxID=2803775 RepID=A0ABS1QZJ7_9SPHI|nr:RagB/SusD family nutrient uptake outer membrane protein [Sphingobacterium faecale]MBL1407625.1 RagB/SusD family nutrient uptake outer membrane protein [Sphingobacterium faecale]